MVTWIFPDFFSTQTTVTEMDSHLLFHLPKIPHKISANTCPQHSVFVCIFSCSLKSYKLWDRNLLLGTYLFLQCTLHKAVSVINIKKRRKDSFCLMVAWLQINCAKHIKPTTESEI